MTQYKVALIPGDGIGPEVMAEAVRVLDALEKKTDLRFTYQEALIGGAAYDTFQEHFPESTAEICSKSDAILFGSVGGPLSERHLPKWNNCEANSILAIRKRFEFSTNFRPVRVFPALYPRSPIKESILKNGVDILFVRELLGDVYFGEHSYTGTAPMRSAFDSGSYSEALCAQSVIAAFEASKMRKKKVTLIHKANVLSMSKLWVDVAKEIAPRFPECKFEEMLVDNCAMQLVINPCQFDVVVASNLFGDILSDLGAALPGTLGLSPSASLNSRGFGLYEPAGGSAPDIAGKGIANPSAQILSAAMMLEHSLGRYKEGQMIRSAVEKTITNTILTGDMGGTASTKEFVDHVIEQLLSL